MRGEACGLATNACFTQGLNNIRRIDFAFQRFAVHIAHDVIQEQLIPPVPPAIACEGCVWRQADFWVRPERISFGQRLRVKYV